MVGVAEAVRALGFVDAIDGFVGPSSNVLVVRRPDESPGVLAGLWTGDDPEGELEISRRSREWTLHPT